MNINDWQKFLLNDEDVIEAIQEYKNSLFGIDDSIDMNEIKRTYNIIVNNQYLSDRAKLFYLETLENLLIKSRIASTNDLIEYTNSLFK